MSDESTIGVQQLIDRLSDEGVAEGQRQAEQIVSDARSKAEELLAAARREADEIIKAARAEGETFQAAGEEALRLASRDAVREFGGKIHEGLRHRLQQLVHHEMQQPELIREMILEISRHVAGEVEGERLQIHLPPHLVSEEEARQQLKDGDPDALTRFVQGLIGQDLREGVSMQLCAKKGSGVTIRVVDQNVEIDLTEETITELLSRHLLPRFRAVMRESH